MRIILNSISKVKNFVSLVEKLEIKNAHLIKGRYSVAAESILGIFSFDLTKPIELICENITEEQKNEIISKFGYTEKEQYL